MEIDHQAIINELRYRGIHARWEYPGYVAISTLGPEEWQFGTANGTWDGDLVDANSVCKKSVHLGLEPEAPPYWVGKKIAAAIGEDHA